MSKRRIVLMRNLHNPLTQNAADPDPPKKRALDQTRSENDDLDSSRDGSQSPSSNRMGKTRREPEASSPNSSGSTRGVMPNKYAKTHHYPQPMDTDSPASYPKHVIVPSPPDSNDSRQQNLEHSTYNDSQSKSSTEKVVTPILTHEKPYYDGPRYRPSGYGGYDPYGRAYPPPPPPDMEYGGGNGLPPNVHLRSKRWACDFCGLATFSTYEEACAHEEVCRHAGYHRNSRGGGGGSGGGGGGYGSSSSSSYSGPNSYPGPPPSPRPQLPQGTGGRRAGGLGALIHATQEVQYGGGRMPPPGPDRSQPQPPPPPPPAHHAPPHHHHLPHHPPNHGSYYGGPPPLTPHMQGGMHHPPRHPHHPPSLPTGKTGYSSLAPRFQDFHMSGYGGGREDPHMNMMMHQQHPHHGHLPPPHHHPHSHHHPHHHHPSRTHGLSPHLPSGPRQRCMSLAMPTDADSLSDRQCYVRSEFVEVFEATEKDVAARHSKGAQKLVVGQVGIRCMYCAHLRPKDRAERAVCYPSSISRIYQTVADMQRFHFEQCREIPPDIRKVYKSLKTTRPRGVGSPQTYWIQSAKLLNLVDSEEGIRFGDGRNHDSSSSSNTPPNGAAETNPNAASESTKGNNNNNKDSA